MKRVPPHQRKSKLLNIHIPALLLARPRHPGVHDSVQRLWLLQTAIDTHPPRSSILLILRQFTAAAREPMA
eukprot:3174534-Rhodomonas_salina.1